MTASTITALTVDGLKVDHAEVRLGRLNLLLGRVGSGKSALHDAVQFAAQGCVPRIGKTNALTAKLMRGDEASVEMTFLHDGERASLSRRLTRDGVKLLGHAAASWLPARTGAEEAGDLIRSLFGASAAEAEQNLDIMRLLSGDTGSLAATVEKLLDAAGIDPAALGEETRKLFGQRLQTLRPSIDGAVQDLPAPIAQAAEAILPTVVDRAQRSIADAVLWARDAKNEHSAQAKETGAARRSTEARLDELKAPAEASEALRGRRKAAADRAQAIRTTLDLHVRGAQARLAAAAEVERASRAALQAGEVLRLRREAAAIVPEWKARAMAITPPPAPATRAFVEVDADALADADKVEREADGLRDLANIPRTTVPTIDREELAVFAAEREMRTAEAHPWAREVEAVAAQIDEEIVRVAETPVGKLTARLRAIAAQHGGDLGAIKNRLAAAHVACSAAVAARDRAQTKRNAEDAESTRLAAEADVKRTCARKMRDAARAKADAVNRAARAENEREMAAWRTACAEADAERRRLLEGAERLEQDARVAERVEADARNAADAARAKETGSAEALTVDEPALQAEAAAVAAEVIVLDAQLAVVDKAAALREEFARLVAQVSLHEARRDVYAVAEWTLVRVRDEDLRRRAGGLEEPMRRFLAPVVDAGEPMVRAEKGKVSLGLRYGELFVDAAALSGGQATLFRAALGYAVLVTRAPTLRVLHVEMAEACDGVLEDQIFRACEAVQDEVQVLVSTCVPILEPGAERGWHVVRVGKEQVHASA